MIGFLESVANLGYYLTENFRWVLVLLAVPLVGQFAYMALVWLRGKNADYNQYLCDHWDDGSPRGIKVNLNKALRRKETWPKLMLPLTLLAATMITFQFMFMNKQAWFLMATLWFLTTPLRTIARLAVSRRAWHNLNLGRQLNTTLSQDVWSYYRMAWGEVDKVEDGKEFQPLLRHKGFGKVFNTVHKFFYSFKVLRYVGPYLKFYLLSWGYVIMLIQAAISWLAWPVMALAAPFYHLYEAEDFAKHARPYHEPLWRNDHGHRYDIGVTVIDSTVVQDDPDAFPATTTDAVPGNAVVPNS